MDDERDEAVDAVRGEDVAAGAAPDAGASGADAGPLAPQAGPPRQLRPAEAFNARPGRRGPARDAAQRHGDEPAPLFDFATGRLLPAPFPRRGPGAAPDPHDPPVEERGSRLPPGRGGAFPGGNPSDAPRRPKPEPVVRPVAPPLDGGDLLRVIGPPSLAPVPEPPADPAPDAPAARRRGPGPAPVRPSTGDPGPEAPEGRGLRASPPQPSAPPRRRNTTTKPGARPASAPGRPAPGGPRRLGLPVPIRVTTGQGGRPRTIDGDAVEAVRESWLIEDRWWTDEPLRRRYWEVVTAAGRNLVVFRDLQKGTWAMQR